MAELITQGSFVSIGEERAAQRLAAELPQKWLIICNKCFVSPRGEQFEVDFIIVGRHGLFVADEKSIRGEVRGNENEWILASGEVRRNPLNKLHYVAGRIAGFVREAFPGIEAEISGHFVTAVVLLSDPSAVVHVSDPRVNRQVLPLSEAAVRLQEYDAAAKGQRCSIGRWRQEIAERLHLLPTRAPVPKEIGCYEILERIEERPFCTTYRARVPRGSSYVERTLSVYDLSAMPTQDRAQQVNVMRRDYQAVTRLEGLVHVPHVHDPFTYGDRFLIIPSDPWDLQPLAVVTASVDLDHSARLAIVRRLFCDLEKLHSAGVIHRNLSPHTVCVKVSEESTVEVGFTGFQFARLQAEQTIAVDITALRDITTPFEAPEVVADMSAATPGSDMYSAAVIALELLTKVPAAQIVEMCRSGQPDQVAALAPPPQREAWAGLIETLVLLVLARPDERETLFGDAVRMAKRLDASDDALVCAHGQEEVHVFSKGDVISGQYRVDQVFPPGATAITYQVTDLLYGGQFALKQILREDCRRALAAAEFQALRRLQHPAIVRVYDVRPPDAEFHLKLEFVSGPSLAEQKFPWPVAKTHELARALLDACAYLAEQGVYHRDISPKNIIMSESGPKLIDFGVAHTGETSAMTVVGTPRYRAPEIDAGAPWDASCDTYAASVVLFKVLTGCYPFEVTDTTADKHSLVKVDTLNLSDPLAIEYAKVLQEGCHPDRELRTRSARELLQALEDIFRRSLEGDWVHNDFVADLQAIYRNSRTGNADNRGLDTEFAERTYVPTLLDERLLPAILQERLLLVLLSGNPGDGKTAFLEHVRRKLEELGAEFPARTANGWRARFQGRVYAANYDASESHRGRRANEILDEMLQPLAGPSRPPAALGFTALIAINDGRLRDYFLHNDRYGWLGNVIYHKLRGDAMDRESGVVLVDLKNRCLTARPSSQPSLFERVLLAILEDEGWKKCERCKVRAACPIRFNRDTLADGSHGELVRARLAYLFHLSHLRGTRHTTIRDLRSVLSYIVAGVRSCEQIHRDIQAGPHSERWYDALYFNAVFNPNGEIDEELEDLARHDVRLYPAPRWDRFLHYNRRPGYVQKLEKVFLPDLRRDSSLLSRLSHSALGEEWHGLTKRRLYFEMDEAAVQASDWRLPLSRDLLPYRYAETFSGVVLGEVDPLQVRTWLCEGISASDGIVAPAIRAGYLCVRTAFKREQEFTVFKRYPVEEFSCQVLAPSDTRFTETCPNTIAFAHVSGEPLLRVHLDLFELLMRMREGYVPDVLEWQPYLVDLAQFKTHLQRRRSDEVILIESGRLLHRVYQKEGTLVREPLN